MRVRQDDNGVYTFRCYAAGCGKSGTLVDAIAYSRKIDPVQVIKDLFTSGKITEYVRKSRCSPVAPTHKKRASVVPVPDEGRLHEFLDKAIRERDEHWSYIEQFGRGITHEIASKYCVGFRKYVRFQGWRPIENVWCIPVQHEGKTVAVKLHLQKARDGWKSGWAPFGTEKSNENDKKPRCAYLTFWPSPEWFDLNIDEPIFICPGELKALACLSLKLPVRFGATAHTQGEGVRLVEEEAKRFEGKRVVVVWDDDPGKTMPDGRVIYPGRDFRDHIVEALIPYARLLQTVSFGRIGKPLPPPEGP